MSSFTAAQSGTATVGGTSAALAGENLGRTEIIISNTHATQSLDVQLCTSRGTAPTAVAGQGIRIPAGSTRSLSFKGSIAVIGSGAGTTYAIAEY